MQITKAAKDQDVRLVAIAKERNGWEEFTRDYWPPPAEIYFDTAEPGYRFFKATNGKKQGVAQMLTSYMFGGEVANNLKRSEHIQGRDDSENACRGLSSGTGICCGEHESRNHSAKNDTRVSHHRPLHLHADAHT